MSNKNQLPQHLAIMIDGNRRWARQKGLPDYKGHEAGIKRVLDIIDYAYQKRIKVLTLYGFSTENWKRSPEEVNHLMQIFITVLEKCSPIFYKKKIQFRHLGKLDGLPKKLQKIMILAQRKTRRHKKMILNIAINYGGRDEMVRAVQGIIKEKIPAEKITEQVVMDHLDTKGLPDVDLVIRTSGVMRLSNFLPLQSTYAELYFPKIYWPDFTRHQFDLALQEFQKRQRRFGK